MKVDFPPPPPPGPISGSALCLGICAVGNIVRFQFYTLAHTSHPQMHPCWIPVYKMPIILKHASANLVINVGSGDMANRISDFTTKKNLNSIEEP